MSTGNDEANPAFAIISAIAMKDASVQDIAGLLRKKGINSVEDVIDQVRREADQMTEALRPTPIDFRKFAVPVGYEPRRDTVQQVPEVPVVIEGTLYDPTDIRRFDGQELHFVASPDGTFMIAIADRAVIGKWWEMTYISSILNESPFDALGAFGADQASERLGHRAGSRATVARFPPTVNYFEDINFGGWSISHGPNRGYADLTRAHMGVFGDWNDKISSVNGQNLRIAVLHEHINWVGATFSVWSHTTSSPEGPLVHPIMDERNLHAWGWGDRASSVEGW